MSDITIPIETQQTAVTVDPSLTDARRARMLEAVLASSSDQVYVADRAGRILYASVAGLRAIGRERDAVLGRTGAELGFPAGIVEMLARQREAVFTTGQSVSDHVRFPTPDGVREYDYTYSPITDDAGAVESVICAARDVTETQRTEEALRRQAAQLRLITDASPSLIAYIDADQRYRFHNATYAQWLGKEAADITGRHVREVVGPVAYNGVRAHIEAALAGRRVTYEREMAYEGVSPRYVQTAMVPDIGDDGKVRGFVAVVTDLTERRAAERALEESRQRFQSFFEHNRDAVFYLDEEGRFLTANDACETLTGYPVPELISMSFVPLIAPEDLERTLRQFALTKSGEANTYEVTLIRRDGRRVEISITDAPVVVAGQVVGVGGIATDISERKRLEREQARLLASARARADREALINRIGEAIRSSLDPDEIQRTAAAALGAALGADRCYFSFLDTATDLGVITGDYHRADLPSIAGPYAVSEFYPLTDELIRSRHTQVIPDIQRGGYGSGTEEVMARRRIRACIRLPLFDGARLTAVLAVAMADTPRDWTPEEIALVEAVGTQTRSAVESARLTAREHQIAYTLQTALQPPLPEAVPGLALQEFYRPALSESEIGGDWYDVFPLENGRTALVVGDLSGKGLAAAAQLAAVRNMLRAALYSEDTLAGAITSLNRMIVAHGLLSGFATLFVGSFDAPERTLSYVNCGQESALVCRAATGLVETLPPTGPVLGMWDRSDFEERVLDLSPLDVLACFTDGVTEIGPRRTELLGTEGIARLLEARLSAPARPGAETLVTQLMADVTAYAHGDLRDDVCLLIGVVE